MKEIFVYVRNAIIHFLYTYLLKRFFFLIDPEKIHDSIINTGKILGKFVFFRKLTGLMFSYSNKKLEQTILGIKFENPVGLAAGFDKDAEITDIIPHVGFGFEEVGSITGEPCSGNPKPRLWRLKKSKSLVVYYGLKNKGCVKLSENLKNKKFKIPIGTSIAKTNCQETVDVDKGIADYVKAFKHFTQIGDYFTINISCPNAFGGQPFTDHARLDKLMTEIDKIPTKKPIFLKLSPDITTSEIDKILEVSKKHRVHGFICTNLTKNRVNNKIIDEIVPENGGLSGKVVEHLADDLISNVYKKTKGKYVIIGCGGVFNAKDAYKKIKLGASLVQLVTGMIFEGPQTISQINQGLVRLLNKDGYENIRDAVGKQPNA